MAFLFCIFLFCIINLVLDRKNSGGGDKFTPSPEQKLSCEKLVCWTNPLYFPNIFTWRQLRIFSLGWKLTKATSFSSFEKKYWLKNGQIISIFPNKIAYFLYKKCIKMLVSVKTNKIGPCDCSLESFQSTFILCLTVTKKLKL